VKTKEKQGVGQAHIRVDGKKKVMGQARYAGEFTLDGMLYAYVVSSAVARGKVSGIKTAAAERIEGVKGVMTHVNRPSILSENDDDWRDQIAPLGRPFRPLWNNVIEFSHQPLAVVVADTFEAARCAASLVEIEYERGVHTTDMVAARKDSYHPPSGKIAYNPPPETEGDPEAVFATAERKIDVTYHTPDHHHNPMEPHATLAHWNGDKLKVWTKTQGVMNTHGFLAGAFGLDEEQVEVVCPFVGGAFGCGLRPQYQLVLAALASRAFNAPVRLTLTREQMFSFGHRPYTIQRLRLAADESGRLNVFMHDADGETSKFEHFTETVVNWGASLYPAEHRKCTYNLVPLDLYTPLDMRAPGGATGVHALECAMDELSYEVGVDPLQLRLINYTETDPASGLPFSSKELKACYQRAADSFGWSRRKPEPRSMTRDGKRLGMGMATGIWEVMYMGATVKAEWKPDGTAVISTASADIGTGTYTILAQIAAEELDISTDQVEVRLGDSSLPQAPIEGGSMTAASVGSAVKKASSQLRKELDEESSRRKSGHSVTVQNQPGEEEETHAKYAHSASFAEVEIHPVTGSIRVSKLVIAVAAGKILNPKTARSQILGCATWGIGMALQEESVLDQAYGRFMNHNLAEYHVPVNADVPDTEVIFVPEEDKEVNPLGVKGLGEVGMVGLSAAIVNAVYHATGKRVRHLPIKLDSLL